MSGIETVFFSMYSELESINDQAVVIDIRPACLWRLAVPAAIFAIRKTSGLQEQHGFDNKRTSVRKPNV
jgi:hypothetical protein